MKRFTKIMAAFAALTLCFGLAACNKPSFYSQETLDEAAGIRAEAENGREDQAATTEGALVVTEHDIVIISPDVDKGSFHLTITSSDKGTVVFDDNVDGRVLFTQAIEPGTYDVTTYGNNVTGSLVVAVHSQDEWDAQNDSLAEALDEADTDLETVPELGN
ncbi:MAG: hypothetical protein IKE22_05285 [Atopobiaceae bacterium]|nr:hypothetical protein [Atopobiaceae bacterium]